LVPISITILNQYFLTQTFEAALLANGVRHHFLKF